MENVSTVVRMPLLREGRVAPPAAATTQVSVKDAASLLLRTSVSCNTAIASSLGTYGLTYLEWRITFSPKSQPVGSITIGALALRH